MLDQGSISRIFISVFDHACTISFFDMEVRQVADVHRRSRTAAVIRRSRRQLYVPILCALVLVLCVCVFLCFFFFGGGEEIECFFVF